MNWLELHDHVEKTFTRNNEATFEYIWNLWCHAQGSRVIMEIGVGPDAASGTTFAAAMGEGGTLYSLDIDETRPNQAQKDFIRSLGVEWIIVHGDTLGSNFTPNRMLDLLYIDGDHDNEHIANDYKLWGGLVRSGGFIIFDDCRRDYPPVDGNCKFVEYDPQNSNGHFVYLVP